MPTSGREGPTATWPVSNPSASRAAVVATLARLSAAWQNRRYDELAATFDERIVMTLPGFSGRLEGRGAIVESYREFMERATLTHYQEQPPAIDIWGDTAVASYRWEMRWLADGVPNQAAGYDVFVFRRVSESSDAGEWRAVWRTMTFEPDGA